MPNTLKNYAHSQTRKNTQHTQAEKTANFMYLGKAFSKASDQRLLPLSINTKYIK